MIYEHGVLCKIEYPFETHFTLESREIAFAINNSLDNPIVTCTKHGRVTVVLCAKFQTIGRLKQLLWTDEISRNLGLRWVRMDILYHKIPYVWCLNYCFGEFLWFYGRFLWWSVCQWGISGEAIPKDMGGISRLLTSAILDKARMHCVNIWWGEPMLCHMSGRLQKLTIWRSRKDASTLAICLKRVTFGEE